MMRQNPVKVKSTDYWAIGGLLDLIKVAIISFICEGHIPDPQSALDWTLPWFQANDFPQPGNWRPRQ